jgi:hypothetical protein
VNTLQPRDEINLTFDDTPGQVERAFVSRVLTDQQEGLGPEIEDYVASWLEISISVRADVLSRQAVVFGTDSRYSMGGRKVAIRKP